MNDRTCEWCKRPIRPEARSDAKTCSKKCRQAKQRFRVGVAPASSETRPMSFGYADPPYPGLAKRYYGPLAQEVNHRILIGTLEANYPDGWALSTSEKALRHVLPLCPPEARVCVWIKGSQSSVANRFHSAWEPLIVVGGRRKMVPASDRLTNTLVWKGRQHSYPGALVGMKPAAFCEWMFRLLGAERQDSMTDIFPGSGAVSRAWDLYTSHTAAIETSRLPGRFEESQGRLAEQLSDTRRDGTDRKNLVGNATASHLRLVPSE